MRIFDFWVRIESTITVDGKPQPVRCYGGSNLSSDDARKDAARRVSGVVNKIQGTDLVDEKYEADIREEIVARIDDRNVVTRNRYGAEILNSAEVMFVDIDQPRYRFWEIFASRSLARRKERIVAMARQLSDTPVFEGLGIRLYETHSGVRAIVTGRKFDAQSKDAMKLMRSLNADPLYAQLCRRQGCFRARLTPKPYRMKCKTHRVVFPREDAQAELVFKEWLAEYEKACRNFVTCRFIGAFGAAHRNVAVIDFHDKATGASGTLKLA